MRRFLEWTSAQAGAQQQVVAGANNGSAANRSSQHNKHHHHQQQQRAPAQQQQQQQCQPPAGQLSQARELEVQHLSKLLQDIKFHRASSSPLPSATSHHSQRELSLKVHRALPLFLNVFSNSSPPAQGSSSSYVFVDACMPRTASSSCDHLDYTPDYASSSISSKPNSPLPLCNPASASGSASSWSSPPPPLDRCPDLAPFSHTIAKLFVSEVRQRASNKHAQEAGLAILQFLNPGTCDLAAPSDQPNLNQVSAHSQSAEYDKLPDLGWNLLLSLNALVESQSAQIIQLLCDASMPSTLVKCLYLFFDLPDSTTTKPNPDDRKECSSSSTGGELLEGSCSGGGEQEGPPRVSATSQLIRAFSRLLTQLCCHQSAIDELIRKDDLRLLIGLTSSQCPAHNRPWRKTAFQTLLSISKNMRTNFSYLISSYCIPNYVENMNRIISVGMVSMDDYIEIIRTLIEFVHNIDVNNRNQSEIIEPLISQFEASHVTELIEDLIIKLDDSITQELLNVSPILPEAPSETTSSQKILPTQQSSITSEHDLNLMELRQRAKRLIQVLVTMAKININRKSFSNIMHLKPLALSRFEMFQQFKMPKPSACHCILNYEALRLLKMAWSRCQDSYTVESILDATISLFNDDKFNYFIFESQQLLVYYMTSNNFQQFSVKVKQKLFKFLEFLVIETNYILCLELSTLGTIIKKKSCPDMDLKLGLRTLIACLRFNPKFSDIFREIGLLEVVIELLIEFIQQDRLNQGFANLEVLFLLLEVSQLLLDGPNNQNCLQFNESGAARQVFSCLSNPIFFRLFNPAHSSSSDESGTTGSKLGNPPLSASLVGQPQWNYNQNHWFEHPHFSSRQFHKNAFAVMRHLILSTAGDEHLANLLGLLARNLDDLKSFDQLNQMPASLDKMKGVEQQQLLHDTNFIYLLSQEVNLKICILKSLIIILKDNHRCRTLFRKVGGFVYLVSALDTLENSLPSIESLENGTQLLWKQIHSKKIWRLIKNVLMAIVIAVRYESANMRAFSETVSSRFTEAIRRLGCFRVAALKLPPSQILCSNQDQSYRENFDFLRTIFLARSSQDSSALLKDNLKPSEACCQLFRFLFDMSLDFGDGTAELESQLERYGQYEKAALQQQCYIGGDEKSISFDQGSNLSITPEPNIFKRRSHLNSSLKRLPSLDLKPANTERPTTLTYPTIILTMFDLIPSCPDKNLMSFICTVLKSLFRHEANQQILCEAGLISKLLNDTWQSVVADKSHFLHETIEYMLESLARQSITTRELKTFLRLEDPLRCKNLDEIVLSDVTNEDSSAVKPEQVDSKLTSALSTTQGHTEKISTNRIVALTSMMSNDKFIIQPPFILFDMNLDGLSSLFLPSLAPVNVKSLPPNSSSFLNSTLEVHTAEKSGLLGGVGSSERQFPPTTGLTFSTWICVEKFPARSTDPSHNLKLLTIYRGSAATGKEFSCFRVQISAQDEAITVSTQEILLIDIDTKQTNDQLDSDSNLRVWTPELLQEGRWHHIAITLNHSLAKQSTANVYVDGQLVHQQRLCYISGYVGTLNTGPLGNPTNASLNFSPAAYVNAFVGSLPQIRVQVDARWKQGPFHLIEDNLSSSFIAVIYTLGPNFIGNFQNALSLSECAKLKSTQQLCSNSSKYRQKHQRHREPASQHRPLVHQQSGALPRTSQPPVQHSALMVSSSVHPQSYISPSQASLSSFQLPEERVLIGIDSRATSMMTLSRMRKIYTRFDCRQISRVLTMGSLENSTPVLLLHNTGIHFNGPSRGIGAVIIGYHQTRCFVPSPTQYTLLNVGGCYILLGFIAQSQTVDSLSASLECLVKALKFNVQLQTQMDNLNGYQILSVMFWKKKRLLNERVLNLTFSLITDSPRAYTQQVDKQTALKTIHQPTALRDLIFECFDLWVQNGMVNLVLDFIYEFINSNVGDLSQGNSSPSLLSNSIGRSRNLKCLRELDLLPRMLRLLPQHPNTQQQSDSYSIEERLPSIKFQEASLTSDSTYDTKAVYLIRQIVFELLNRTPRQSDILYFGQFLASLLPHSCKERSARTVELRNMLLKSLLQMMTKNNQIEVNQAIQEELVRILGFDWFLLFISGTHLDQETITIGLVNFLILLSNDEIYTSFKQPPNKSSSNGAWLKEPVFQTIEGNSNIQLLGMNAGVFFGLSGKRKSIKKDVLEAPNFFLLTTCFSGLSEMACVYLMVFHTMMGRMDNLSPSILDSIDSFRVLSFDSLCDCLVGDTHHKRRITLADLRFKCHELVVCLVYMIRVNMQSNQSKVELSTIPDEKESSFQSNKLCDYAVHVAKFIMYLYNNSQDFQGYCKESEELVDALCACLIDSTEVPLDEPQNQTARGTMRKMNTHAASKEILELCRLIILDSMTSPSSELSDQLDVDQLDVFEKFMKSFSNCSEAQGELVDMLLRQVLLIIDSTARHNNIKTIAQTNNLAQFQLLLTNSVLLCEKVTDKIWLQELYISNWSKIVAILEHQLCLAEQVFKFNQILPKHNPPHAFIMQRSLNCIILYAISRPMQHISDKMIMLDLLKKIFDNRTIIILNHMHCSQSADFFVCLTYWLAQIIEENIMRTNNARTLTKEQSLIEKQLSNPTMGSLTGVPSLTGSGSSELMIISLSRKIWDSIYQSKKGVLSEALDVSLSLPAFTLDTSPDLLQLKPDIEESCKRHWSSFVESKQTPKSRRTPSKQPDSSPTSASTSTVNLLSGRLTRVVNAASFVSRVVGATAGTMASNVNMVGEKLSQTSRHARPKDMDGRFAPFDGSKNGPGTGGQGCTTSGEVSRIDLSKSFKNPNIRRSDLLKAFQTHISIIDDYIITQLSQKSHILVLHKYLCDEWLDSEYEILLRERAIFGPPYCSKLDKWCLDLTEGPRRMRKKMLNNTRQFYENYPYLHDHYNPGGKSLRHRPPVSYDSHLYYLKNLNLPSQLLELPDNRKNNRNSTSESQDKSETSLSSLQPVTRKAASPAPNRTSPSLSIRLERDLNSSIESLTPSLGNFANSKLNLSIESPKPSEGEQEDSDWTSFVDFSPEMEAENDASRDLENVDSLSVLRLLEKNEHISHMFRCSRVQGLDTFEGLLLFGREHFYLIDGFTLLKTREIRDIDSLPLDAHDPIMPNSAPNTQKHSKKTCYKFSFDSISEVHKRRYLLQPIALEVFSSNGRNTLIVFPRNIRNKVYSRLMAVSTQITSNAQESLAGQKSNVSVEGGSGLLSNLIGETSVTQRWIRGELSNFQYLMNLNTIAGRSYNDLMQYPIFPWILADYTSDCLNLSKASTFRDLSRPVGAQTSERLEQFKRRYADWDDTETPPYHYGTFYSSAMIVASYLVRMEPFTQHFLRLQGGHFDLADRMFHSVHDSWMSASRHNMADIKELVPEFFYCTEFLMNNNKYDLGAKQSGMKLSDVVLPPWAKGDPKEFIRVHRCALESDYVSAHLHEWIDLIFGYKQQGQAAVDAVNVFHHLFYEGNVDIYNNDIDPIKKNAVIGFINNFGQVPKQLFKKPHPSRRMNYNPSSTPLPLPSLTTSSSYASNQRVITRFPQALVQSSGGLKNLRGPVGQIVQMDKSVLAVEQNKLLIPPEYCRCISWGYADRSLRMSLYDSEKPIFIWEGSNSIMPDETLCCTIPNSGTMITAGTECSIQVWKIDRMKSFSPFTTLYGHAEPVTCLASSQSYSIIVSGSRDRSAIVWDLNRLTFVRQLGGATDELAHQGPVSAIAINDSSGDIVTCSSSWLYLWSINGELIAHLDSMSCLSIQPSLCHATTSVGLTGNLGNQLHLLSVCFSQYNEWDLNEVIVVGASDGSVSLWSMRYYQQPLLKQPAQQQQVDDEKVVGKEQEPAQSDIAADSEEKQLSKCSAEKVAEDCNEEAADDEDERPLLDRAEAESGRNLNEETTSIGEEPKSSRQQPQSEPISIIGGRAPRKRTDTINSEWVRLSNSSTSTIDTNLKSIMTTPTPSLNEMSHERLLSSPADLLIADNEGDEALCSPQPSDQQSGALPPSPPPSPTKHAQDQASVVGLLKSSELSMATGLCSSQLLLGRSPQQSSTASLDKAPQSEAGMVALIGGSTNGSASADVVIPETPPPPPPPPSSSQLNPTNCSADNSLIKFSKSDNALIDSFVFVGEETPGCQQAGDHHHQIMRQQPARPQSSSEIMYSSSSGSGGSNRKPAAHGDGGAGSSHRSSPLLSHKLLPGHCWKRQLYLRAVLPRRSAAKTLPAAITSITISKDHKSVFVGDASGKITTWLVS